MKTRILKWSGRILAFCLSLGIALAPGTGSAAGFDAKTMERMSTFLSNFTELGMVNFQASEVLDPQNPGDMIRFGIWHNYINNFKSRVATCTKDGCQWGSLTMDCKYVKDSLKRYFDYDLERCISVENSDPPYHFDGTRYHFEGADGETIYHAKVSSAEKLADGNIRMQGIVHNADDESDVLGTFTALAKPHTWKGKSTWAIISMNTKFKGDDQADLADDGRGDLVDETLPLDAFTVGMNKTDVLKLGAQPTNKANFFQTSSKWDGYDCAVVLKLKGDTVENVILQMPTSPAVLGMLFAELEKRGLFPINLDDELLYTRPKDEVASFVAERIAALSEQEQGKLTVLYVPEPIFDKAAQAQNEDQLVQELASTLLHTVQIDTESITLLVATGSSLVEK